MVFSFASFLFCLMHRDKADEMADIEGTPGLTVEVIIIEDCTIDDGRFGALRALGLGNEVHTEGAVRFADGAVFFPIGEGAGGGLEPSAEVLEIPGVFEDLCPGPAATGLDEGVLVENMRHMHDARSVSAHGCQVLRG